MTTRMIESVLFFIIPVSQTVRQTDKPTFAFVDPLREISPGAQGHGFGTKSLKQRRKASKAKEPMQTLTRSRQLLYDESGNRFKTAATNSSSRHPSFETPTYRQRLFDDLRRAKFVRGRETQRPPKRIR